MKHLLSLAAALLLSWSALAQITTTFNVDMTCAPSDFENVFVTGPWCGWCANEDYNTMTDPDGDGIYSVGVFVEGLAAGAQVEYKYAINGFADQENLVNDMNDGASCAPITDNNAYANRLTDQGSTTDDYYGTCDGTCNDVPPAPGGTILFRVDMSEYEGSFGTVNLNGSFNGWCGSCAVMTDDDQDMVYELAVDLPGGTIEYKFTLDGWTVEEVFTDGDACTSTIDGYVNRTFDVTEEDATLDAVCWNSCEVCSPAPSPGCMDEDACNFDEEATEDDGSCEYDSCAGCTDPLACNYDEAALIDNGSCEFGAQLTFGFAVGDALCYDGLGTFALDSATLILGDTAGIAFAIDTLNVSADTLILAPGSYTLTSTDTEGCSSDTMFVVGAPDTLAVTVNVVSEATPGIADGQAEADVTGGTPGADGYGLVWNNMTGMSVNPDSLAGGLYTVIATDSLGCSATASFTMTVSEVDGLGEVAILEGALFPVPVGDELNIRLAAPLTGDAHITVRDAQGRVVMSTQMRQHEQRLTLDATSWTSGIYTLQLNTEEAAASWKFVK